MSATLISSGYTGLLYIGFDQANHPKPVLMTKYNLEMGTGLIKNEAIGYRTGAIDMGQRSYMLPGVMGPAEYRLSVSAEASMDESHASHILQTLAPSLIGSRKSEYIRLRDASMGVDWAGYYYVTSVGISASEGGVAAMDVQLAGFGGKVATKAGPYSMSAFTAQSGENGNVATQFAGDRLVGYWAVSCKYDWMKQNRWYDGNVIDFAMNFSQSVEPVYLCDGSDEAFAPSPSYVMFGMPTKTFDCTHMMHTWTEKGLYDEDYEKAFTEADMVIGNSGNATIYFWGREAFKFGAVLESLSVDYSRDRPSFRLSASAT